jgi:hypothetical protein
MSGSPRGCCVVLLAQSKHVLSGVGVRCSGVSSLCYGCATPSVERFNVLTTDLQRIFCDQMLNAVRIIFSCMTTIEVKLVGGWITFPCQGALVKLLIVILPTMRCVDVCYSCMHQI